MPGDKEMALTLKTEDGYDQTVQCFGSCPEAQCRFKEKKVDCGVLSVRNLLTKFTSTLTERMYACSILVFVQATLRTLFNLYCSLQFCVFLLLPLF